MESALDSMLKAGIVDKDSQSNGCITTIEFGPNKMISYLAQILMVSTNEIFISPLPD